MFVVTGKEMKHIDQVAMDQWNIPELVLMENAGKAVVEVIKEQFPRIKGKKIIIIAGKGNNGGDGLVVARHLSNQGADVKVFTLGNKDYRGAALVNYRMAQKLPIQWYKIENKNSIHLLNLALHYTDIVIDALFGTGFKGEAQGLAAETIETINGSSSYKIAVDVPSGLNADTGTVSGPCIQADLTVTFALPKLGLFIGSGDQFAGKVVVKDIGIPPLLIESLGLERQIITKEMVALNLPRRRKDSHKGSFGHLLIIAGSLGMMGAAYLAVGGAYSLGAGLVSVCVPQSIQSSLASSCPEAMIWPVSETNEGTLGFVSGPEIINKVQGKTAIVFGPGLGQHNEIQSLLKWLISQVEVPLIIDADGLNALAADWDVLKEAKSKIIITPHPGEMARLLGISTGQVQKQRLQLACSLAKEKGIYVVLKGYKTIIATPEGKVFINPTGGPALATAGTGDVLAGMIGAMVGQTPDLSQALLTAVYLHGLAGDRVAEEIGEISSKATDLLQAIPKIIKKEFEHAATGLDRN